MSDEINIYRSKRKQYYMIVAGLLLAGAGIFLLYKNNKAVGWSSIIFSVLILTAALISLFDRKPVIVLSIKGISDKSVIKEIIEWDAIKDADEFFYRGLYYVRILMDKAYKPEAIVPHGFYRFSRIYEKSGVKAVFIQTGMLDVSSVTLTRFIKQMINADENTRRELFESLKIKKG